MKLYETDVAGTPAGWQRARACVRGGHAAIYDPRTGTAGKWRNDLVASMYPGSTDAIDCPVTVTLAFRMPRPKSHIGARGLKPSAPLLHAQKPDLDNLVKLVLDAMVEAGVLSDDCGIVSIAADKAWCHLDAEPGCHIVVCEAVKP